MTLMFPKPAQYLLIVIFTLAVAAVVLLRPRQPAVLARDGGCNGQFLSVSQPLNDLGNNEYIRMDGTPTGFNGGLYPNGSNQRPVGHNIDGLARAALVGGARLPQAGAPAP